MHVVFLVEFLLDISMSNCNSVAFDRWISIWWMYFFYSRGHYSCAVLVEFLSDISMSNLAL